MKKARVLALLIMLAMVIALVAACGPTTDPATGGGTPTGTTPDAPAGTQPGTESGAAPTPDAPVTTGGVMRLATTAEGANPIGVPWLVYGVDNVLMVPTSETLFIQTKAGVIYPLLAESYDIELDNNRIVITVRQGVEFHDGSAWNADVAVWNLTNSMEVGMISNAITNIVHLSEYEFALEFETFSNDILPSLTTHTNAQISRVAFEANGEDWARENPVGTGPFILERYIRGAVLSFVANPNYWQEGYPLLDGVEFHFIRDAMTQNIAIQADGDQSINVLQTTSGEQISQLREMGFSIISSPMGTMALIPSSENPDSPFAIQAVREAVSYAINREAIVAARGFGVWTPGHQMVAEAFPAARLPDSYNASFDPDRARELLAEAGFPNGFSTEIFAQPGMSDRDALVAIQSMLAAVGITAELHFPDGGGYSAIRRDWEGLLFQHVRALPQIDRTFNFFFGQTQTIYPNLWAPDEMEDLIVGAARSPDNTQYLQGMARLANEHMLVIPVHNQMDTWVTRTYVHNGGFTIWDAGTNFRPGNAFISE